MKALTTSLISSTEEWIESSLVTIYRGALALTLCVYVLISIGGLVRNAGAGLACPDWPLCHGQVVPDQMMAQENALKLTGSHSTPIGTAPIQIFLEWFHRLIAGSVSVLLLALSSIVFFSKKLRPVLWRPCVLALVLLAAQVVLGGLTVLGLLSPKWVTSHLAVGLAFFGSLLWTTLKLRTLAKVSASRASGKRSALKGFFQAAVVFVFAQAVLGGLVSSNYAGLACPDFPTCQGQWMPLLQGNVALHFAHRVGALFLTVYLLALLVMSQGHKLSQLSVWARRGIPVLVGLQILLGISMVLFQIPLLMSVAHLAIAAALFAVILVVTYEFQIRNA